MVKRELMPKDGRKSFYGKAYTIDGGRWEALYSYGTLIARRDGDGLRRYWPKRADDFTATTGRHIAAWCGLNKAAFLALPLAD